MTAATSAAVPMVDDVRLAPPRSVESVDTVTYCENEADGQYTERALQGQGKGVRTGLPCVSFVRE